MVPTYLIVLIILPLKNNLVQVIELPWRRDALCIPFLNLWRALRPRR